MSLIIFSFLRQCEAAQVFVGERLSGVISCWLKKKCINCLSDTIYDTSSNKLTPNTKSLCLIDVGYFMNNSGISLLKPERNVDIIILLDYGMTGILRVRKKYFHYYFPFECLCAYTMERYFRVS